MADDILDIQHFHILVKLDPGQPADSKFKSGRACTNKVYNDVESFKVSLLYVENTMNVGHLFRCLQACETSQSSHVLKVYAHTDNYIVCEPVMYCLESWLIGKQPHLYGQSALSRFDFWYFQVEEQFNPFMRDICKGIQEVHICEHVFGGDCSNIALIQNIGTVEEVLLKPHVAKLCFADSSHRIDFERRSRLDVLAFRDLVLEYLSFPVRNQTMPLWKVMRIMGFDGNQAISDLLQHLNHSLVASIPPAIFLEDPSLYSVKETIYYLYQLNLDIFFYDKEKKPVKKPQFLIDLNYRIKKNYVKVLPGYEVPWKMIVRNCGLTGSNVVIDCLVHGHKKKYDAMPKPNPISFDSYIAKFDYHSPFEHFIKFYYDAARHMLREKSGGGMMKVYDIIPKLDKCVGFSGMAWVHKNLIEYLGPHIKRELLISSLNKSAVGIKKGLLGNKSAVGTKKGLLGLSIFARLSCRRLRL